MPIGFLTIAGRKRLALACALALAMLSACEKDDPCYGFIGSGSILDAPILLGCGFATIIKRASTRNVASAPATPTDKQVRNALAGNPNAQYQLAVYNVYIRRPREAGVWMCRAANNGQIDAQLALGDIYFLREPPDLHGAYLWYSLAEKNGHPAAWSMKYEVENRMTESGLLEAKQAVVDWTPEVNECGDLGALLTD